jgi:hypothetical protein
MTQPAQARKLIMACHITGVYDVNRNNTLAANDYTLVQAWAESITNLGLNGVLFHNNFTEETCEKYQNECISFVKIEHNPQFNPNVYRYLIYRDFLKNNAQAIDSLFVTDVADVVAISNPFVQPLFLEHPDGLFCGDEPKPLRNDWMLDHAAHLRAKITDYASYETQFEAATLLNCGIIGGKIGTMQPFIEQLSEIHERYNYDNKTAYTGDMGAFNYLVRTQYNQQLFHGTPVNTVFKEYQTHRTDCWFRHK